MQVEATHLQLLLLPDHGVILGLEEARLPFQLGHDSCQLLIADLLTHNVLAVGIDLVLNAALLLMLLCDCILQRLQKRYQEKIKKGYQKKTSKT